MIESQLQEKDHKYKSEMEELIKDMKELRLKFDDKHQELEYLAMENESLKSEMEIMSNQNSQLDISSISKATSKYPDVVCPHFKNGGKCKNCIKAWKESEKQKLSDF